MWYFNCSFSKCKYTKLNIFFAICCRLPCMKTIQARNDPDTPPLNFKQSISLFWIKLFKQERGGRQ